MCCGRGRTTTAVGIPNRIATNRMVANPAPITPQSGPAFEYIGRTALTVVGPITGANYRFERPGSRLRVDPRDRQGLLQVPVLRAVG